ncbi:MAG: hypothetical protein DMF25_10435 [Verrucomicrobia bacterium]|nr:MAG: hypothetical protein DMF25_10435 [Verrucomicrobiota bacterium]
MQTTGVGIGTLANRPTSGVGGVDIAGVTPNPPGTAYWATDVPSINGSTDNGALDVWTRGAWVLYYQPYVYPHPLVSGSFGPPENLRIIPTPTATPTPTPEPTPTPTPEPTPTPTPTDTPTPTPTPEPTPTPTPTDTPTPTPTP